MKRTLRALAAMAALVLASCGGSSSTPAPTPAPTPTPTPTPVAATARVYASSLATGLIEFTDSTVPLMGNYYTLGFTARDGRYYPGHANAIAAYLGIGGAAGATVGGDYALTFKNTHIFDHETGMQIGLAAPASVRMATPVTALLVPPGSSAAKVKTQLGITGSLFGMVTDPDLATYDAIAEIGSGDPARVADGERMLAANLRVLAISAGLSGILSESNFRFSVDTILAQCLASGPEAFIFRNDRMTSLIECYANAALSVPASRPSPLKMQAIAHLIDGYAAAMPVRLETSTQRARWLLGLRGYLVPAIRQVVTDNTDAAAQAVLAVTAIAPTILTETSRYAEFYRYNETGLYMPQPDFLTIYSGTSVERGDTLLLENDVVLSNQRVNTRGIDASGGTIQSLAVPAGNQAQIAVARGTPGRFTVTVLNGFKGATYFDYVATASNGEQRTTRVYVRVM